MTELQVQMDVEFLVEKLPHRGANTEHERAAAEYIRDRFKQYAPDTEIDDFYSPDTLWFLFSSYYAEFTVVSLIAVWWPRVALCYGAAVFLAYLAEFMGYRIMGRLLPQYETQNVVARLLSPRPKRLLVVMAHYDTGKAGALPVLRTGPALRRMQLLIVFSMLIVLASCAVQSLTVLDEPYVYYNLGARWGAVAFLLSAAAIFSYGELTGDYGNRVNDNASGTAALLRLAERLAADPLDEADVHLVATGSNQGWMNGARRFVTTHPFDRDTTCFLCIDRVDAGALAYTTAEGNLHLLPCSEEMVAAAQAVSAAYGAEPCRLRTACSDALIPLTRGYKTLEVTAVEAGEGEPRAGANPETPPRADYDLIARAADFAEAILRRLAASA